MNIKNAISRKWNINENAGIEITKPLYIVSLWFVAWEYLYSTNRVLSIP
jgi:hypothetical protein